MAFVTLAVRMMTCLFSEQIGETLWPACQIGMNFCGWTMMRGQLTELDEQESEEVENHRKTEVRKATRREKDLLEKYG